MSKNRNINIFYLLKWLSEQYIQLERKILPYPFKLGCISDDNYFSIKNGITHANVELSGQKDTFEIELSKIIEQNLFEYFSPKDKKQIFYAYYNKERFKLTDYYFCRENRTEMAILTDIATGNKKEVPAELVIDSDEFLEQLSRKDIKKLSFLSAMGHVKKIFKSTKNES